MQLISETQRIMGNPGRRKESLLSKSIQKSRIQVFWLHPHLYHHLCPYHHHQRKPVMKKHATHKANLLASHVAAKTMFAQYDKVKQLEEEITRLHEQLQTKEQVAIRYYSFALQCVDVRLD